MRTRASLSLFVVVALISSLLAMSTASAAHEPTRLTSTNSVDTKMRCRANLGSLIGIIDADQEVGLTVTAPKYIEQGAQFDWVTASSQTVVPASQSGITVINLRDIRTRLRFAGPYSMVSVEIVPGSGQYRASASAPPSPFPGGINLTNDGVHVQLHLPGPFLPGAVIDSPQIRVRLAATGAPGTKISSRYAGAIPTGSVPPFADFGFALTSRVDTGVIGQVDAPISCAPNYGPLANSNGEPFGTQPSLTETTILANTKPLVTLTTPGNGDKYLPEAAIFASHSCTETVYALVSCDATTPDGEQLDFSEFGPKEFTVTATDANHQSTSVTHAYEVGGNVIPEVSANVDKPTANGGELVTLLGSAIDPDTGQVLSYQWSQTGGTPVVLNPVDAIDPFEKNQRFVAPRGGPHTLTFRLRVDDGFDTGEATVVVNVRENQSPVITNGSAQTISNIKTKGIVTMNAASVDPEGDIPLSYAWTQVDGAGDPLTSGPLHVALSAPTAATTTFTAPQGPVTLHFRVAVTDSLGATTTGTVDVSVLANVPPVLTAGASQTLLRKTLSTVQLNGSATDADNNAPSANHVLSFAWTQVDVGGTPLEISDPARVTLSSATVAQPTFTAPADPTTLYFRVSVSDTYSTVIGQRTVTVVGSDPPVANAGPDQTPGRGRVVTLNGTGSSDPDLDPITYAWTQVDDLGDPLTSGPLVVTLSSATAAQPTFTAPIITGAPQALYFELVVTDVPHGLSSPVDTVVINLLENQAPVANAGANQTNKFANNVVTLTGSASSDIDTGETLTYSWVQVDPNTDLPLDPGPTKVTLSSSTATNPTFVAPHFAASTTLKFSLVVTDTFSASSAVAFTTVQINANRAPTVGAPSVTPATRTAGVTVTLTVPASTNDADGDPVSGFLYQWRQTDSAGNACAPTCAVANVTLTPVPGTPRSATFTAPGFTAATPTLYFRLTVDDGFGATVQSTTLTVTQTNSAPVIQVAIRPSQMAPVNSQTNNTTVNQIYNGQIVELDATQNPAQTLSTVDPDGTTGFTYLWRHVTTSGGSTLCTVAPCFFGGTTSQSTLAKPVGVMPNTAQVFLRLTVTDQFGLAATVLNFTLNRLTNTAPTVGASGPAFATIGDLAVPLTGTATDPQTSATPSQSLTYLWTQVDAGGSALAPGDPLAVTLLNPTTLTPTFNTPLSAGTVRFKLSVTDGAVTVSATHTMTIVLGSNAPPDTNAGPDQSGITAGATVTLDGSGTTDAEGHSITYQWTQVADELGTPMAPTVTLSSATAQKPTFAAPANGPVTLYFRLVATDQFGAVGAADYVAISVNANGAPLANAGADQAGVTPGATVTLDGSGSDPDGHTFTYLWSQVDGAGDPIAPTVTLSSATAQKPTFTAPGNGPVVLRFALRTIDQFGLSSTTDIVDIDVNANNAPVADAGPFQPGIIAGATVTLDGSGSSDPDGHTFTYFWVEVDSVGDPVAPTVTLSSNTVQKPTFTAPGTGPVSIRFALAVTDQFGLSSPAQIVRIDVEANGAPVANAGPDQSGRIAGTTVTLDGSGSSDPDGNTFTYAWTEVDGAGDPVAPTVTLSSSTAQKPTFTTPASLVPLTLRFALVVTDQFGLASAADVVEIGVAANIAPVASAGPNQSGRIAGTTTTLDGSGSADADGHTFTYAWTEVDGGGTPVPPTVTLSSSTAQKPTFTTPASAVPLTLRFALVVTDQFGLASAAAIVEIGVAANGAPVANAGPNQVGLAATTLATLDGSGTSDPEGHAFTYAWTQVNHLGVPITPTVTLSSATAQKPTFTTPSTATGTTLRFSLVATDLYGATSAPAYVVLSVGANQRPFANAGPDQTPGRGKVVTLNGTGSFDPEGTALTYEWVQIGAGNTPILPGDPLAVTLSSSTAASPTFTAPVAVGVMTFRLYVTDASGRLSDPDDVLINLIQSNAPVANAGAAQTNRATNSVVTLNGTASSDLDSDPLTYAWTQVDPTTNLALAPGDPTAATLSSATAASPTFVSPHFAASTTLKFQLVVTDVPYGLSSPPAFTTVQINANRAPTIGTPTATPASRPRNTVVSIQIPAPANDADGDPAAGFTYQWVQTTSAGVACSPTCAVANVAITNSTQRIATFVAPNFTVASATLYFRLTVNDGFGATVQSTNLTVALANTAPTVPNPPSLKTGIDGSVINPANIYVGSPIEIDATSIDPDLSGPLTYVFSGQPCGGLGEALGCLFASGASGWPGGSCRNHAITPDDDEPGKATFTAPTLGASNQNPNVCGLRVVVTDSLGASTTRNWSYGLKVNAGPPVPRINTLPAKVLASSPAAPGVIALSGSTTTDPDTNPTQPLAYSWTQIDPATGEPVAESSSAKGSFSNPNSVNTTWTAGTTAPHQVVFRLTATDGISLPASTLSPPVSVTTRRPGTDAGPDRLTNPGNTVLLDGSLSSDPGNLPLTYSWRQVSGPTVNIINPFAAQASFVAPFIGTGGTTQVFSFELTTRNGLAASFDQVTVVNEPYARAVASAGANQSVDTGQTGVQLDGSGSSTVSGSPLSYLWTQVSGPTATLSSATAQQPTFTAPPVSQAQGPQDVVFELVVTDAYGSSLASSTTVTVNPVPEVPYAPTAVAATPANAAATVTFTPGIDGGSPILSYTATCTSPSGATGTGSTTGTSATVTGLTNGALYTCTVRGTNAIGAGAVSAPSSQIRPAAPPSAPTNVTAVTGNGTVDVSFTPGSNGGEPFTIYAVICDSSDGGPNRGGFFGPGVATLTGLPNGKTYTCVVIAAHALGLSPTSAPSASFVVGAPAVPTAVSATPGIGSATVSWTTPVTNNGAAISAYIVTPYIGATAQSPAAFVGGNANSTVISGLTHATAYTFRVTAVNSRGQSPQSAATAPVTIGVPGTPSGVTAVPGDRRATVSWTAPTSGAPITGYVVTAYRNGVNPQIGGTFYSQATTQVITGLENNAKYTFVVQAFNSAATGAGASSALFTIGVPSAPATVTATAGAGSATVVWSASEKNGAEVTGYIVIPVRNGVDQAPISYSASPRTRVISGLTPGAVYRFKVIGVNSRGESPESAPSNAVTPT